MPKIYKTLILACIALGGIKASIAFERNAGQVHDAIGNSRVDVLFTRAFNGYSVLLREDGFSYQYSTVSEHAETVLEGDFKFDYHRIDIDFVNQSESFSVRTPSPTHKNTYYLENGRKHIAAVFNEVVYENVFDGVDIQFLIQGDSFKYNIICRDEKALEDFRLRFDGSISPITLSQSGAIILETLNGKVEERVPLSFFEIADKFHETNVKPAISDSGNEVSFNLKDEWPVGAKLIIDPLPYRLWSTYLGGQEVDELHRVDADSNGDIYVSGFTGSLNNIATSGAYQGSLVGFQNSFLAKYDSDGNKIWGTYFGGTAADRCYALRIDESRGCLYIGGSTLSNGLGTIGVHQPILASTDDAFLAKFNLEGQLQWCTYYGGEEHDFIADIDLDSLGNPVVTGHTRSTTGVASDFTALPGFENAFIAKFSTDGLRIWGTYFGGWFDEGWGIVVDENDDIYVCGVTSSTDGISTLGAHQIQNGGGLDAFIVKYSPWGEKLWGTYLGGTGGESANDLVLRPDGSVVIVGDTESFNGIATSGAYQSQPGSTEDGFISLFAPDGTLSWSTYVGGGGVEYLHGITLTTSGNLLVTGQSESSNNIASASAFQAQPAGEYDAILMSYDSTGQFLWGTYLGGQSLDIAYDVTVDELTGHAVIGGTTRSQSGVVSSNAPEQNYSGGLSDSFLARVCAPIRTEIESLDGTKLCGDGELQFTLLPEPASATWQNSEENLFLTLESETESPQIVYADLVDTTGCPGSSDTVVASFFPAFDDDIELGVSLTNSGCLGTTYYLSVAPQFEDLLWWDETTNTSAEFTPSDTLPYSLYVTAFDDNGCTALDSITVQSQLCLGNTEVAEPVSWMLYPNPSDATAVLTNEGTDYGSVRLDIFSIDGRFVDQKIISVGEKFSLSVPSGMYRIRITQDNGKGHHFGHVVR
ncbi:SBBP repeat-containing protein [Flavobacteriales bacterium]|nr:SBBP repeat-containing protein [Flavobacteriales bacterium]